MGNKSSSSVNKQPATVKETSSRCLTDSDAATHNFEVSCYSLLDGVGAGKLVGSDTFAVGGHDWSLSFYPDGDKEPEDTAAPYASVFLVLSTAADVHVKCALSLVAKDGNVYRLESFVHAFKSRGDTTYVFSKFVEKSVLQELMSTVGEDDCFTIRCKLTVIIKLHTEAVGAVVVPVTPSESDLPEHFADVLNDVETADVTFDVGGQSLHHAHKCVLRARSPVFKAELVGQTKENAVYVQHMKIDDMEPSVFMAILHFIYTDSLPDNSDIVRGNVSLQQLLVAADRYGLERLKAMCEQKLCLALDVQTVATTLLLAHQHDCMQLKDTCLGFMSARCGELWQSPYLKFVQRI